MLLKDTRLRAFYTVALHRSFTKAAKHLLLSQQAVSFQVKGLESAIGVALFRRTRSGIDLTEAGQALYRYAERILGLYSEAEELLDGLAGKVRGHLRLAATNSLVKYRLPAAIGRFRSLYPDVKITIEVGNSGYCVECLGKELVDIAFVSDGPDLEHFDVRPFFRDEIALIAPPDDPVALAGRITLDQLRKAPFVAREEGSGTRSLTERLLGLAGIDFDQLNVVLILGSTEAVKAAVEAGAGIGVVSRMSLQRHDDSLVVIKLDGVDLVRDFYAVQRAQERGGRHAARFLTIAQEVAATAQSGEKFVAPNSRRL